MAEENNVQNVGFTDTTQVADTQTTTQVVTEPAKITPNNDTKKYWEDEYKVHFGDDDVETVKGYKTKASEYEAKVKDYENQLKEKDTALEDFKSKRFFNEKVAKINELAESGVEITPEFVAFINKDYSKIENPIQGLAEALRYEHPDWSEKKIQFELKSKYRLDQIANVEDDELTDEQKELKEIIEEDLNRDWKTKEKELTDKQEKLRLVKTPTPEEIEQSKKEAQLKKDKEEQVAKDWAKRIEKASKENNSIKYEFPKDLGVKVNDKDVEIPAFEYPLSKEEKSIVDKCFTNVNEFWKEVIKEAKSDEEADKMVYNVIASVITNKNIAKNLAVAQWTKAYETFVKADKKSTPLPSGGGLSPNTITEGFK